MTAAGTGAPGMFVARVSRSDGTESFKAFADAEAAERYWVSLVDRASAAAENERVTVVLKMYEAWTSDIAEARRVIAEGGATETKWVRIRPPKPLRSKVRTEGPGLVTAAVLERAQATADAKSADYPAWALADLRRIEATVGELRKAVEDGTGDIRRIKERLYRQCYRMRGQGGTFGYGLVTDIAARFCHLIEGIDSVDARGVESLRVHLDAMRLVVGRRLTGDGGETGGKLLEGLRSVREMMLGKEG